MKRLGQFLIELGWINNDDLARALQSQEVLGGRLGTCLLEMEVLTEDLLMKALAHQLGVEATRLVDLRNIPEQVFALLPPKVAIRCQAIPFRMLGNELYIAMLDVHNLVLHDEISFATGKSIRPHIANEVRVFEALEEYYGYPAPTRFRQLAARLNTNGSEPTGSHDPTVLISSAEVLAAMPQDQAAAAGSQEPGTLSPPEEGSTSLDDLPPPVRPLRANVDDGAAAWEASQPQEEDSAVEALDTGGDSTPAVVEPRITPQSPAEDSSPVPQPAEEPPAVTAAFSASSQPRAPIRLVPPYEEPADDEDDDGAVAKNTLKTQAMNVVTLEQPSHQLLEATDPADWPTSGIELRIDEAKADDKPPPAADFSTHEHEAIPSPPQEPAAEAIDTQDLEDEAELSPFTLLVARLNRASSPDDVAHTVMAYLGSVVRRVAIVKVVKNTVKGWMGAGEDFDSTAFRAYETSLAEPSIFLNLRQGGIFFVGPLAPMDSHQRLVSCWHGHLPKECVVLPIRIRGRLVAAVVLDLPPNGVSALDLDELSQLSGRAGEALEACIVRSKRSHD